MTHTGWRDALGEAALRFAGVAAFPRLTYLLRWPTRLGPRGFAAFVAYKTLEVFGVRYVVVPYTRRLAEQFAREESELTERLGREPTQAELAEHFEDYRWD